MKGTQRGETIWQRPSGPSPEESAIILALFKGEVTFANGETGTYAGVETIDMGNEERFSGSHTFLLADGSVSIQTFEGEVVHKQSDTKFSGVGTWTIVSGTRRFAALRGGGSFRWQVDGEKYIADFSAA